MTNKNKQEYKVANQVRRYQMLKAGRKACGGIGVIQAGRHTPVTMSVWQRIKALSPI